MKAGLVVFASALFVLSVCGLLVLPAAAHSVLVWEGDVSSSGAEVSSSLLSGGVLYRVVATEVWLYDNKSDLAADAMYYTTNFSSSIFWGTYLPLPGGGSFLQINGQNVSWGPFSDGNNGNHTYTYYYTGTESALTFKIMHWTGPIYDPEAISCHLHVKIYMEVTVGGHIEDAVPSGVVVGFVVGAVAFAAVGTVPVIRRHRQV